jgi:hypothetical protein
MIRSAEAAWPRVKRKSIIVVLLERGSTLGRCGAER